MRVPLPLTPIQFTNFESLAISRIGNSGAHFVGVQRRKLRQKLGSAFVNQLCQFRIVIGKENERLAGAELLSLKQQRSSRSKQHNRRQGAITSRTCKVAQALAMRRV